MYLCTFCAETCDQVSKVNNPPHGPAVFWPLLSISRHTPPNLHNLTLFFSYHFM